MGYKLKKNDNVQVMAGKERGKTGRIVTIERDSDRAIVEGLNMVKKAMRAKGQKQKGGITEVEAPIHVSNLMIVCKKCGPTRVGYKTEGDTKVRVCRKCGENLG